MQYTHKSIRLHTKCLKILRMIAKVNDRNNENKKRLLYYHTCKDKFDPIRLFNTVFGLENAIEWDAQVKARLVNYYATVVTDLIGDIVNKIAAPTLERQPNFVTNESY